MMAETKTQPDKFSELAHPRCDEPFMIGFNLDSSAPSAYCRRPKGHSGPHSISSVNFSDIVEEKTAKPCLAEGRSG